jgi:putative flippase GtrA
MDRLITRTDSVETVELSEQEQAIQEILSSTPSTRIPSYHPTSWSIVNSILDIADTITGGRAGLLQRLFSFLLFGGIAAIVNLIVFYIVFYHVALPVKTEVHNIIAFIVAAEISLITNFIPNDRYTFRHLPGRTRSWPARCARFHVTSISGTILTFLIEFTLSTVLHVPAIISQAIAILIVTLYNFVFHHFFTYRHVKVEL